MAIIFLSYRRTDSPQACRVYDWLAQRFGEDAVFMDVSSIPFAINYLDYIKQSIAESKIMIALIGAGWLARVQEADDPVRTEIELALANQVPILPVMIGNTPVPAPDDLPESIAALAYQNVTWVGVSQDFHTHMQMLLPKIEAILGKLATQSKVMADARIIEVSCEVICRFLAHRIVPEWPGLDFRVVNKAKVAETYMPMVTLYLHRVTRLAEVVELHFILSVWAKEAAGQHHLAGWVMQQFEQTPLIPQKIILELLDRSDLPCNYDLKIRRSDEDPRQIWKMITDDPLQLSLAYVATVTPR